MIRGTNAVCRSLAFLFVALAPALAPADEADNRFEAYLKSSGLLGQSVRLNSSPSRGLPVLGVMIHSTREFPASFDMQVFSKHLRELRGPVSIDLTGGSWNADAVRSLTSDGNIQRVRVDSSELASISADLAERWEALRGLSLNCPLLTNEGIKSISRLKHLQSLSLTAREIDNEGLKPLSALHELKSLTLSLPKVNDGGLQAFDHVLAGLERLDLTGCDITGEGLGVLSKNATMTSLSLSRTRFGDAAAALLQSLPLQELILNDTRITNECLPSVGRLEKLMFLRLGKTEVNDEVFSHLAQMKQLRFLDLSETMITGEGFDRLAELPVLQVLICNGCKISNSHLGKLSSCPSLVSLGLNSTLVTDIGIKELTGLKTLSDLSLRADQVTAQCLAELVKMPALRSIDLMETPVTEADARQYAGSGGKQRFIRTGKLE